MLRDVSSQAKHALYADSSKPGPSPRLTSTAAPMIRSVNAYTNPSYVWKVQEMSQYAKDGFYASSRVGVSSSPESGQFLHTAIDNDRLISARSTRRRVEYSALGSGGDRQQNEDDEQRRHGGWGGRTQRAVLRSVEAEHKRGVAVVVTG